MPQLKGIDWGIITPYNNQIQTLEASLGKGFEIATVHKFQGREKDTIIISTVDNVVTSFSDDASLLNVAVSRAKKSLYIVVSGNEQPLGSNLNDLIEYMNYNNFTIIQSKVSSVFDILYKQYDAFRKHQLRKNPKISTYDSENIMFSLIQKAFSKLGLSHLGVVCHQPMCFLVKDFQIFNEEERKYAQHPATHLDFLIYNQVTKRPVLAIEVDGYSFHQKGSTQHTRDQKKDKILNQIGIPLLRFSTTGSGEEEKLEMKLKELLLPFNLMSKAEPGNR